MLRVLLPEGVAAVDEQGANANHNLRSSSSPLRPRRSMIRASRRSLCNVWTGESGCSLRFIAAEIPVEENESAPSHSHERPQLASPPLLLLPGTGTAAAWPWPWPRSRSLLPPQGPARLQSVTSLALAARRPAAPLPARPTRREKRKQEASFPPTVVVRPLPPAVRPSRPVSPPDHGTTTPAVGGAEPRDAGARAAADRGGPADPDRSRPARHGRCCLLAGCS